jgi:hypothetical protein
VPECVFVSECVCVCVREREVCLRQKEGREGAHQILALLLCANGQTCCQPEREGGREGGREEESARAKGRARDRRERERE